MVDWREIVLGEDENKREWWSKKDVYGVIIKSKTNYIFRIWRRVHICALPKIIKHINGCKRVDKQLYDKENKWNKWSVPKLKLMQ